MILKNCLTFMFLYETKKIEDTKHATCTFITFGYYFTVFFSTFTFFIANENNYKLIKNYSYTFAFVLVLLFCITFLNNNLINKLFC